MCGADHGPDHDDPAAAEVCDLYHAFDRPALSRLGEALDEHERELLWQVAVGVGPEGLARRFGTEPAQVRGELTGLAARLVALGARPA